MLTRRTNANVETCIDCLREWTGILSLIINMNKVKYL